MIHHTKSLLWGHLTPYPGGKHLNTENDNSILLKKAETAEFVSSGKSTKQKRSMEGGGRRGNLEIGLKNKNYQYPFKRREQFSLDTLLKRARSHRLSVPETEYSYRSSAEYLEKRLPNAMDYSDEGDATVPRQFEETYYTGSREEQIVDTSPHHDFGLNSNTVDAKGIPPFNYDEVSEDTSSDGSINKLYGQNLALFGHTDQGNFINSIKNCSKYRKVNLFSKYSMTEIADWSDNSQLILYFNTIEVNEANYEVALESITRILDYFTMTYHGLALYSLLHTRERQNKKFDFGSEKVNSNLHWKLSDAIMTHCSIDNPRCHVTPDLRDIVKALNQSYLKDQTLEEYESKTFSKSRCISGNCHESRIVLDSQARLPEQGYPRLPKQGYPSKATQARLPDLSPNKQLEEFGNILCTVPCRSVLEFVSRLPNQEEYMSKSTQPTPRYFC